MRRLPHWSVGAVTLALWAAGPAWARLPEAPVIAALHAQAVEGQAQARYDLGIALLCGKLVPRDPAQAALWLALASAQDHRGAQSVFGWQLMTATGVKRDDLHAAHWLQKAATSGDTAAQNNLGVLYAVGRGVAADRNQAERWFRAAAEQGASDAERNLALLLGKGSTAAKRSAGPPSLHPALASAGCGPLARTAVTPLRRGP
jgi:uncharacterized protein